MDVIAFGFGDAQSPGRAHRDRVITAAVDFVDRRGRWCTQCSRSLAAALGTSDRMPIYHFGSKDALIADVGALANRQLADSIGDADPPVHTIGGLVHYAWQVVNATGADAATRLCLQMCVLSVDAPGRWSAAHEQMREP